MSDTLTARLLAEIEQRMKASIVRLGGCMTQQDADEVAEVAAYLAALRKIVDRHRVYVVSGDRLPICAHCDRRYPCVELMDVATALDVTP